jgi:hypothetical protein
MTTQPGVAVRCLRGGVKGATGTQNAATHQRRGQLSVSEGQERVQVSFFIAGRRSGKTQADSGDGSRSGRSGLAGIHPSCKVSRWQLRIQRPALQ